MNTILVILACALVLLVFVLGYFAVVVARLVRVLDDLDVVDTDERITPKQAMERAQGISRTTVPAAVFRAEQSVVLDDGLSFPVHPSRRTEPEAEELDNDAKSNDLDEPPPVWPYRRASLFEPADGEQEQR